MGGGSLPFPPLPETALKGWQKGCEKSESYPANAKDLAFILFYGLVALVRVHHWQLKIERRYGNQLWSLAFPYCPNTSVSSLFNNSDKIIRNFFRTEICKQLWQSNSSNFLCNVPHPLKLCFGFGELRRNIGILYPGLQMLGHLSVCERGTNAKQFHSQSFKVNWMLKLPNNVVKLKLTNFLSYPIISRVSNDRMFWSTVRWWKWCWCDSGQGRNVNHKSAILTFVFSHKFEGQLGSSHHSTLIH